MSMKTFRRVLLVMLLTCSTVLLSGCHLASPPAPPGAPPLPPVPVPGWWLPATRVAGSVAPRQRASRRKKGTSRRLAKNGRQLFPEVVFDAMPATPFFRALAHKEQLLQSSLGHLPSFLSLSRSAWHRNLDRSRSSFRVAVSTAAAIGLGTQAPMNTRSDREVVRLGRFPPFPMKLSVTEFNTSRQAFSWESVPRC